MNPLLLWSFFKRALPYLLVVVALAGVWMHGRSYEARNWKLKDAQRLTAEHADYVERTRFANAAARNALAAQATQAQVYQQLQEQLYAARKTTPLITRPQTSTNVDGACAIMLGPGAVHVDDSVLSLGAVWLWNSALAGSQQAAGACGIDAATGQAAVACAAPSGLPLDAAWDNHLANAQSCAADRLRHQHLIDYLKAQP